MDFMTRFQARQRARGEVLCEVERLAHGAYATRAELQPLLDAYERYRLAERRLESREGVRQCLRR